MLLKRPVSPNLKDFLPAYNRVFKGKSNRYARNAMGCTCYEKLEFELNKDRVIDFLRILLSNMIKCYN